MEPFPTSVFKFIRPLSCYTLLSGFRLPWPPCGCLDELTPFVVSDECIFRHLNLTFGSSRIASSAYQKWPTRDSHSHAHSFAPIPKFDDRFARQNRYELPPEFPLASPYSGIVHHLSGPNILALTQLLGPCFKTGHLKLLHQHPQQEDLQSSLTSSVSLLTISHTVNSLSKVLFIFPSRYLFAIGLSSIFSLRWNLPPTLSCIPKQLDS
ncbi:hypothetical protein PPACK8108_LOCUS24377 [Phakopsora pachyrhizi]|uniref:Uncharacterized protein n=1 Tax=Phakopsora pachyrhizi TaxID=170000 RepID=A0AAV0BUQ1_PHAPC|nr:hypothetical protein PPACK8108_LOCUS24213 [Phakopsora pachyrhizi]CAH7689324.1 hypothetical protein PPACK8108_LOCUS24377 [Phakopsora pachyrhizi]